MSHELRARTHNLKLQARRSKLVASANWRWRQVFQPAIELPHPCGWV